MTEPAVRMRALLHGQVVSRALCVVAELRLADELRAGPCTADELAARVSAHPGAVRRLLRALSAFGVFAADADGAFRLTPLGATLCEDAPGSARPTALLLGGPVGTAWTRLGHTARTGESAFTDAFGADFFGYLTGEPELHAIFDRSQTEGLRVELDEVFDAVDFTPYRRIVDVGGGDGELLARLLAESPEARGRLLDLPGTVARAGERFAARGVADRCTLVAGDFFAEVPSGGDLYLLSHVLHDWDDERAIDILRVCRKAMPPDATLKIIDLLPDDGTDDSSRFAAGMDLYLMSLFGGDGGGERGDEAVRRLLREAGLEPRSTLRLPSGMGVVTASR
ncbi:methyltransferase [Actinoallomurus iriomotensis]|uniref:Methyltransferase n=1 Tax=Actinoallomurus iriomotensis TaxID=478107 RepID=A0A9W6VZ79_9ACTN|nr:methyltransferase [Actinoallomurus iriomotensis]GLY85074.1 methyltransferase [Actinoallomurus iriomotensis]